MVVAITGASDGIGRATAHAFAKKKASLILIGRSQEKLDKVEKECESLGARCSTISLDVKDARACEDAVSKIMKSHERIDVWINNAGVAAIGSFTDVPLEEHTNVIETNLLGYMNCAHPVLKVFKKQQKGILINNASVVAYMSIPNFSAYTASKFAVRGFTLGLRQELLLEGFKDVHACVLAPAVVDTKVFDRSAKFGNSNVSLHMPVSKPEDIAKAMVALAENPRAEVVITLLGKLGVFAFAIMPRFTGWVLAWMTKKFVLTADTKA